MEWLFLAAIALVFIVYELFVYFVVHRGGSRHRPHRWHTLSEYIWMFQDKYGIVARIIVAAALLLLGSHLLFEFP